MTASSTLEMRTSHAEAETRAPDIHSNRAPSSRLQHRNVVPGEVEIRETPGANGVDPGVGVDDNTRPVNSPPSGTGEI